METILIKLSGEIFSKAPSEQKEGAFAQKIISQIKELKKTFNIGIVVGAGNIFRGNQHGKQFDIKETTAHTAGMVATIINGLVLKDLLEKDGIETELFSAINCPEVACVIKQNTINKMLKQNKLLIFTGGTGNPFFTTDTNAVLRALQIGAKQVLKGTKVDGIYETDPLEDKDSKLIKKLTYKEFIEKELKVMDLTAITLAQEHKLKIKVFNLFKKEALLKAIQEIDFGSTIS